MNTGWKLINVEERNAEFPDTFLIETRAARDSIAVGEFVKVAVENRKFSDFRRTNAERFWVRIIKLTCGRYDGVVDNDLVLTDAHGLKCGDVISFGPENILSVTVPDGPPPEDTPALREFRERLGSRSN